MGIWRATRGWGLLERFLARQRIARADHLIPETHRQGRLLDVGCGHYPLFLRSVRFARKFGLDQSISPTLTEDPEFSRVTLIAHDIDAERALPFEDSCFDVVTALAVVEHLWTPALKRLLRETHRVLKPGGRLIVTTPARWTDLILRSLARVRLVSSIEVEDHKNAFTRTTLCQALSEAGFAPERTRCGFFELFANIWAVTEKCATPASRDAVTPKRRRGGSRRCSQVS